MADLDDRGQIILVAGFAIAAAFVALALVLNSVIFTENLATRGEAARGSEAVQYRDDVVRATADLVEHVNEVNDTSQAALRENVSAAVNATSNATARRRIANGQLTNASLESIEFGTRIVQDDPDRNFTNASAPASRSEDWTLVSGVEATRSFRINVTDDSILDLLGGDEFTVVVEDGSSNTWTMSVADDGSGDTEIEVTDGDGDVRTCGSASNPTIDVTGGTFDGDPCRALRFAEDLSPPYEVRFEDAQNVEGTFTMVVDSSTFDADNYAAEPDVPFARDAVYGVGIHVRYESDSLVYETDAEVIPGESDD